MTSIEYVAGREVLDSRGNPTVEVEVYLEGGLIAYRPAGELTGGRQLVV